MELVVRRFGVRVGVAQRWGGDEGGNRSGVGCAEVRRARRCGTSRCRSAAQRWGGDEGVNAERRFCVRVGVAPAGVEEQAPQGRRTSRPSCGLPSRRSRNGEPECMQSEGAAVDIVDAGGIGGLLPAGVAVGVRVRVRVGVRVGVVQQVLPQPGRRVCLADDEGEQRTAAAQTKTQGH